MRKLWGLERGVCPVPNGVEWREWWDRVVCHLWCPQRKWLLILIPKCMHGHHMLAALTCTVGLQRVRCSWSICTGMACVSVIIACCTLSTARVCSCVSAYSKHVWLVLAVWVMRGVRPECMAWFSQRAYESWQLQHCLLPCTGSGSLFTFTYIEKQAKYFTAPVIHTSLQFNPSFQTPHLPQAFS